MAQAGHLRPGRAWSGAAPLALGLALAAGLTACGEDADPLASAGPPDRVLLVGADAFGDSARVAWLLNDMAAATDVLGAVTFEVLVVQSPWPGDWIEPLSQREPARAVLAVVGSLALLPGVNPSLAPSPVTRRIRRDIDFGRLRAGLAALEQAVSSTGATFVPATAPLGWRGRVEMPELLDVESVVRVFEGALDLASAFRERENAPRFVDGVTRLDDYGHDALARFLFERFVQEPGPIPARDDAERAARLHARALAAFARGEREAFDRLARRAVEQAPRSDRAAVRLAAIDSAHRGLAAAAQRWADLGPDANAPGLVAGRLLSGLAPGSARPDEPVEAGLLRFVQAVPGHAPGDLRAVARELVDAAPHRLEAWILFQAAHQLDPPVRDVRGEGLRQLSFFCDGPVSADAARELMLAWPATLQALPALLAASRPHARLQPVGPTLEAARRRARLGYIPSAHAVLARALERGQRFPASWRDTLRRLEQGR